jgi:hypothetical protein
MKLLRKAIDMANIRIALQKNSNCCKKHCLRKADTSMLYQYRYNFWIKTREHQTEWIYDKIGEGQHVGRKFYLPFHNGMSVCATAFQTIHGINKNFYYRCLNKCKEGAVAGSMYVPRSKSEAFFVAVNWLEEYVKYRADRMPHTPDIKLPYGTKKTRVWKVYKDDIESKFVPTISESHFLKMWNAEFPHIKIKKVRKFAC